MQYLLLSAGLFSLCLYTSCGNKTTKATPPVPSQYQFKTILDNRATPVANQFSSGTCWCFSTTSFLESEIIRLTGREIDLSEMYFVRCAYIYKARNYIMRQGTARFSEGGLNHDPIISAAAFGLVPLSAYSGLVTEDTVYNHQKMFEVLEASVKKYADVKNKAGAKWKTEIPGLLDAYMGKDVTTFTYDGRQFTPQGFLAYTRLNLPDYVTITSFTHEPFYKRFILNIPANHLNESFYNLPLDEYMQNIDHALETGYTLALDLDASEPGFFGVAPNDGLAMIAADEADNKKIFTESKPEKEITQALRQQEFENFNTTDDHNMHITGKVQDQTGKVFYKVKNSWGPKSGRDGYVYMSIPYMQLKSISVLLHKDGLSNATKKRLNL